MNDVLTRILTIVPPYVLIAVLLFWIIVKALPDSAQFFGDFFPQRRRLSRTRATLETIKAKVEVIELAQKYGIQPTVSLEDAIRDDLAMLLGGQSRRSAQRERRNIGKTLVEISYSIFVSMTVVIAALGVLAYQGFKWQNSFYAVLSATFLGSMIGCYAGRQLTLGEFPNYRPLTYFYFLVAAYCACIGGGIGSVLGVLLVKGVAVMLSGQPTSS